MGDPGVDMRIILNWVFRKWVVRAWTRKIWLRIGTGRGGGALVNAVMDLRVP